MARTVPPRPANILLSRLNEDDWQLIAPHLVPHQLNPGHILQNAGDEVVHTWFPCGAASAGFQVWTDAESNPVDVCTVGREGAVGGIVSNGSVPAYATAEVRDGGLFLSIRTAQLEKAKNQSVALHHWFARYSDCLLAQLFQNTACNASHTIRQRSARWLLAASGRNGTGEVALTHEQLAALLGVGRTFVTRTVQHLRAEELIATRRGVFVIRDPAGLRAVSCDCSDHLARHFEAVMAGVYPPTDTPAEP